MSVLEELKRKLGINRAVLALSVARLGDGIGNSILIIVIPLYVARLPSPWFHLPQSVLVGLLIAAFGLVNTAAQPLAGTLSDRTGRRKAFIVWGLVIMGAATLAFIPATRYRDLLLIRALQGIGFACTIPASMAIMTAVTERATRGGSMGVFTTFRMIGFAIGPLLGGLVLVHLGFEAAFLVGAGFLAAGIVAVQLWVEDPPREEDEAAGRTTAFFDRSLLTPGLLSLGGATFVMAATIAMMSTLENEFNARLAQTALGFGVAFSALTVSRLLFQVPLGSLSDRIGRKPVIIAGLVLLMPTTALLGLVGSTLQLTAVRLAQGVASAGVAAPAFALAGDVSVAGGEGRQLSILTMGFGLGIAVGPLLAGFLAVVSFEAPFLIGGGLALVAAWIVYLYAPETSGENANA
ncbi:MAG TPA: MFS transporter [Gemmatimonadota bacterium]|nr:MFS transporter [Gemmatimonadota bacterium]